MTSPQLITLCTHVIPRDVFDAASDYFAYVTRGHYRKICQACRAGGPEAPRGPTSATESPLVPRAEGDATRGLRASS